MKLSPRVVRITIVVLIACAAIFAYATIVFRREPKGYFASYKMIPHDSDDALHFTNGVVVHETCCGRSVFGTYRRSAGGGWISEDIYSKKVRETNLNGLTPMVVTKRVWFTNEIILEPGLLWLTVYEASRPTNVYRLPRKLFRPKVTN